MGSIREREGKKGVTFMAEVRLKGFPPQTASFHRKTDARKWVSDTESAIREGRYFKTSESRKRTLELLIDKYLAEKLPERGDDKETVKPQLIWWKKNLGKYTLVDITPTLIAEYRDKLLKEPMTIRGQKEPRILKKATVIRYLASLSVCLTYGVRELSWLESNPLKQVYKPKFKNSRDRSLTLQERERLLSICKSDEGSYLYIVVSLALYTGARQGELLGLQWKDIDFQRRVVTFYATKNGDDRVVPLVKQAVELLADLNKVRRIDTALVFPRKDGKKPMDMRKRWEKAVKDAGLEDFHFHDLRHTAGSYLAMSGATLLEISHILGHKTLQMVKRYTHLTEQHTAPLLERTAEYQLVKKEPSEASK